MFGSAPEDTIEVCNKIIQMYLIIKIIELTVHDIKEGKINYENNNNFTS